MNDLYTAPRQPPASDLLAALEQLRREAREESRARQRLDLEKQRADLERHIAAGEASIAKAQLRLRRIDEQLSALT